MKHTRYARCPTLFGMGSSSRQSMKSYYGQPAGNPAPGADRGFLERDVSKPLPPGPSRELDMHLQRAPHMATGHSKTKLALQDVLFPEPEEVQHSSLVEVKHTSVDTVDDDDVVIEDIAPELESVAVEKEAIPKDILDLVTDEFAHIKDKELKRRRKVLYDLTHPKPQDYTYGGKLVPPPPLAFGRMTEEGLKLGHQMFCGQHYSLVRQSGADEYFFELNDLYMEVAFLGRANAGKSSLINALTQQGMAKTSSLPNSTRTINFYQSATPEELAKFVKGNPSKLVKLPAGGLQLTLVDVPGFGIDGMSEKWKDHAIKLTDSYLGVRRSINTVFLCIDASKGVTKGDEKYFQWIENLHGLFYVVLTKCDAVPHRRVCTLMKEIYQLMTKHRRKNRKAFPFVLPVSAATGENMAELRALIIETSGLIGGSKMRELVKKQQAEQQAELLALEEHRVQEAWQEQRDVAKRAFLESRGLLPQPAEEESTTPTSQEDLLQLSMMSQHPLHDQQEHEKLPAPAPKVVKLPRSSKAEIDEDELRWTDTIGYGMKVKMNTGVAVMPDEVTVGDETAQRGSPTMPVDAPKIPPALQDRPITTKGGAVSEFLDSLDSQYNEQHPDPKNKYVKAREEKLSKRAKKKFKGTRVFTESDGALQELQCGEGKGPQLANIDQVSSRFNQLSTKRFMREVAKNNEAQPWLAVRKHVQKMNRNQMEAYEYNSGRVEQDREKFENVVTHRKYMTENRFVETQFKKEELNVGAASKISFTSQPPGLLKRYAEQEKYWKTDQVLGLSGDGQH